MNFRFIPFQMHDAYFNMAMDEVLMQRVREGKSEPVIRLYGWTPRAVSIGYFQGLDLEIDTAACTKQGVDIVRRQTGGGAVFHDKEITYSLIAPQEHFEKNIIASYEQICSYLIDAFEQVGISATFSPINDIHIGGRKISGNAQTRKQGILLQHGTILTDVDVDTMFSLLKVGKEKMSDKLVASVKKVVTSLAQENECTQEEFLNALQQAFAKDNKLIQSDYTQDEIKTAQELAKKKYSTKKWIAMR